MLVYIASSCTRYKNIEVSRGFCKGVRVAMIAGRAGGTRRTGRVVHTVITVPRAILSNFSIPGVLGLPLPLFFLWVLQ